MKEFENQQQEAAIGESSELARLVRPWPDRVWWERGSSSGGGIGAWEKVQWAMGSADRGWVTLGGKAVCCEVGYGVGKKIGERGNTLYVWTWGSLVEATEGVGVGSDMQGIGVRGHISMGGGVGGFVGTTLGDEVVGVYGTTIGSGTGDLREI